MNEPCCFIHSRHTSYCAEWDFVNDTTQEYARLDFLGFAPGAQNTATSETRRACDNDNCERLEECHQREQHWPDTAEGQHE